MGASRNVRPGGTPAAPVSIETMESRVLFSAVAGTATSAVFDVRSYGALGDGKTNDEPAITAAVNALVENGSGTLLFPAGTYRDATPGTAITFDGISNLKIEFDGGSTLLMDNLADGLGTGHGILIKGPATNVSVIGAHIKWATVPLQRGFGSGLEFLGYPSDSQTIEDAVLQNITVEGAPQTGAVFMGCSDVTVQNFTAMNTLADGLHFNACRHVTADQITGINTGDDTLAFVTYKGPTTGAGPFSENTLGAWSDSNSTATDIYSTNSHANGCRISGGMNVSISNLNVSNAIGSGLEVDSSIANGSSYMWTYAASRGIVVNGLKVSGCYHAFLANVGGDASNSDDPTYWQFGASVSNISASDTRSIPVAITQGALGLNIAPVGSVSAPSSSGPAGSIATGGATSTTTAPSPTTTSSPASGTTSTGSSSGPTATPVTQSTSSVAPVAAANATGTVATVSSLPGAPAAAETTAASPAHHQRKVKKRPARPRRTKAKKPRPAADLKKKNEPVLAPITAALL